MFSTFLPQMQLSDRARSVIRAALFVYLALALCPVQYWPLSAEIDNTWIFALNYAHAHHLAIGRDLFWTWGPLSYLALPMDVGGNLALGLAFQTVVWAILLAVLWKLFFRSGFPLRNLLLFSVFLGLSAAVSGPDQTLFRCALILLVQYQLRGGISRYIAACLMLGFLPLINFTWVMAVAGAVVGLVLYAIFSRRPGAWREAALAAVLPLLVAGAGYWLALGSFSALAAYIRASAELSNGFNLAMSVWGPPTEFLAAFEVLIFLAVALALVAARDRRLMLFFVLVLAVPLFVSFKHGFVREDAHIHHYFCFVAICLGLAALVTTLAKERATAAFVIITLLFVAIWQDNVARTGPRFALTSTGLKTPFTVWNALRYGHLRHALQANARQTFSPERSIEPGIKAFVRDQPVASLSVSYSQAYMDGLNLALYPIIQRYSAYTPYLDELNATWIRDKGPRFLIFDGKSIDGRHPWTETPAMWLEIYRWYDTRLLGAHNLLLERRTEPRFAYLEPVARSQLRFGEELQFPASSQPVFWTMQCSLSGAGKLRALLFRVLEVTMTVDKKDGRSDAFRVPLAVVGAPSPGNYLPSNLPEFAAVFGGGEIRGFAVEKLRFSGPGTSAYMPACAVEFLRPTR